MEFAYAGLGRACGRCSRMVAKAWTTDSHILACTMYAIKTLTDRETPWWQWTRTYMRAKVKKKKISLHWVAVPSAHESELRQWIQWHLQKTGQYEHFARPQRSTGGDELCTRGLDSKGAVPCSAQRSHLQQCENTHKLCHIMIRYITWSKQRRWKLCPRNPSSYLDQIALFRQQN